MNSYTLTIIRGKDSGRLTNVYTNDNIQNLANSIAEKMSKVRKHGQNYPYLSQVKCNKTGQIVWDHKR